MSHQFEDPVELGRSVALVLVLSVLSVEVAASFEVAFFFPVPEPFFRLSTRSVLLDAMSLTGKLLTMKLTASMRQSLAKRRG